MLSSVPPAHVPAGLPPASQQPALPEVQRYERLDALRGLAVVWMAAFHFCFDLNHFHLLQPRQFFLSDPFWTWQRVVIVTLFMSCAGMGQAVALHSGQSWPRFWRRWRLVAGCAVLVSVGSSFMFPATWISFGVLHGIAVMLLLVRAGVPALASRVNGGWSGVPLRWSLLGLAGVALCLPKLLVLPWLNSRWGNWTGLVSHLPRTEDYVPVLPWLGVMLAGVALGLWALQHRRHWLSGPLPRPLQGLAVLGRWSLSFYMLHQPVFIGGLMLYLQVRGSP